MKDTHIPRANKMEVKALNKKGDFDGFDSKPKKNL